MDLAVAIPQRLGRLATVARDHHFDGCKRVMENLKPLAEVYQPDIRYSSRVDLNKITGLVSEMTIQSIYNLIEPLKLSATVPDEVRSHFETAKNLV